MIGKSKSGNSELIGNEAYNQRNELTIKNPIKRVVIQDWDEMEKIWSHIFTEKLKIDPQSSTILLTEPIHNPKQDKE